MRTCCAYRCQADIPDTMIMCRPHWFGLPKPMRDAIWATHRAKPFDRAAHLSNIGAAIRWTRDQAVMRWPRPEEESSND